MTTPKIDIIDEQPGSVSAIETLLSASPPELADVNASKNGSEAAPPPRQSVAKQREDDSRIQQLIGRWNLPTTLEAFHARATANGTRALDEAKGDARKAMAVKGGRARAANAAAEKSAPKERAAKASGKTYSTVRNVQTAQTLLAQQSRELESLRAELEKVKLEAAARTARAEIRSEGEELDELTKGFAAMLGFLFDGVSEVRRLHYAQVARAGGRLELTADEQTAVAAWRLPDVKADGIARPFAQYLNAKMGPDMLELLPLFIGVAGIGGHVLHGVQAERMAKAELAEMRVVK